MKFVVSALLPAILAALLSCCSAPPDAEPIELRVMTWNIHHGRGLDGVIDLERIAAVIRDADPDVVTLQEVDRGTSRTRRRDLAAELAEATELPHFVFGKNIDYQGGDYGNATLSRHPIVAWSNEHYAMLREGEQRGLLRCRIDVGGHQVEIWNTHIDYREDDAERRSNMREILELSRSVDVPLVVCGDFNDLPGTAVHRMASEQFYDAWVVTNGLERGASYRADVPRKRIDWVLVHPLDFRPVWAEVGSSDASDHLPVIVQFRSR